MTTLTLLDQTETARRVTRVIRVAGKIESELHLLACSILAHVRDHSNTTDCVRLMNGLPRGLRVKALGVWFKKFSNGKLVLSQDDTKSWVCDLKKDRKPEDFDIDGAMEVTYADLTNEKTPVTVTVEALVKMLSRRATDTETNDDGTPKVSPEARALASKLVAYVRETGADKVVAIA